MPSKKKKWTLMFYLASDNPLAPGVISQLKSIKAAGFHKDANVIVQFDPNTEGTPTHIFDVNVLKKATSTERYNIGFKADDPYVPNLLEDKLWRPEELDRRGRSIRELLVKKHGAYRPGIPPNGNGNGANGKPDEPCPQKSLDQFLTFCARAYPAKHYVLFLLGHGVVVGNDVFMYDQNATEHTLSLGGLRTVLTDFNTRIRNRGGVLDLISFHSCSVSSLEVAYELKDQARYMLASQGSALIGNWPYRQILIRIFNELVKNRKHGASLQPMFEDIFSSCVKNSTDFLLGGYPFDLCLCNLTEIGKTRDALDKLSAALIQGLECEAFKESILLAHLESQSFHQEMYTDVVDFCRCLYQRITKRLTSSAFEPIRTDIKDAIVKVNEVIRKSVIRSDFAGPEYQYSRGLSLYFPWSRPVDDVLDRYSVYKIVDCAAQEKTWLDFLKQYFRKTRRPSIGHQREKAIKELGETKEQKLNKELMLFEDQIAVIYGQAVTRYSAYTLDNHGNPHKQDTSDPLGVAYAAPSLKNFPRDTRKVKNRKRPRDHQNFPLGRRLLQAFR
jgi:hypothetical protein